jgi:4-amino-4-deoxy-L-arabinose transferase-like glycosyltransferase
VATALAVALRLPMLTQPMTADEGGYAGVARGWAHGARLYSDVWVDRPQGLLLLYRFVDWLDGGHAVGIRIMAIVFGVGLVWATAWAVRGLAGAAAGGIAAVACAAVTSAPVLEGFAANGELLAGAVAATCVALALWATRRPSWWMWSLSGVAGGLAISLKQSGFDGLLAVCAWLAVVVVAGPQRRRALRRLGLVLAGTLVPLGALAVHGAIIGWDRWTAAMGSYRVHAQSMWSAADWENLSRTGRDAAPLLALLGAFALAGIVLAPRAVRRAGPPGEALAWIVPVAWLAAAILAFFVGGGFWRHYWIQLGPPLAALGGIGVATLVRSIRWRSLVVAALIVPSLVATVWVTAGPRDEWIVRANDDWRSPLDARVAGWLRSHRVDRHSVYAMCASAGLYGDAALVPGYPYLWMVEVHEGPGAQDRLISYLTDPRRAPAYVVQFQQGPDCDPTGRVQDLLDDDYTHVATVGPVAILQRTPTAGT